MHIEADTLDDLLRKVFSKLLKSENIPNPTKGKNREETAVLLKIKNPLARLSRTEQRETLYSCLGETLWYLSGSDQLEHVEHYIPSYRSFSKIPNSAKRAEGAYGPRLFGTYGGIDQVSRVICTLRRKEKHDTRQAVIQIFDKSDIGNNDVPCTCNLQFFARGKLLHMFTTMRSNDAYRGLPHDVFAFTMLQELVARSIDHEIGSYSHAVGSLHLYEDDETVVNQFLAEGWQEQITMPPMPSGDPWPSVDWLLKAEASIRDGGRSLPKHSHIDDYWVDLARILLVKILLDAGERRLVVKHKKEMSSPIYDAFIRKRERQLSVREAPLLSFGQLETQ